MSDVFISYARSTEAQARRIGEALRALGYGVWRDDELPAHRAYSEVIAERLRDAKAVVVLWSAEAVRSEWVQSEADRARADRKLVQLKVDGAVLPMPFDRIQCADMVGWSGDADHPGWRKVVESIAALTGATERPAKPDARAAARRLSICVLPFANISGDPEQEYFSDGISEDIITDLSKVSALSVVARNTAFTFKGKSVRVTDVAGELGVSHVLEGSVRKAGGRVRITAQLIDGGAGDHIWAERWDRDLTDIFAVQDEISQAIVAALKLKLLPEEKKAIERRGTENAEAYDLFLMARQLRITGVQGDPRREEAIVRLCRRAVEIDPNYARAWVMMGYAQVIMRFRYGQTETDTWATVEKALALDPTLSEAHALKAGYLRFEGRYDEAAAAAEIALRLDPESFEANFVAGYVSFARHRIEDAIAAWEKSAALMDNDFNATTMLLTCYLATGDTDGVLRAGRLTVERAEAALAHDPNNGSTLASGASALAALGETDRARDWIRRALLIDPDNQVSRYNLACILSVHLKDADGALDLLGPFFAKSVSTEDVAHARIDPDLDAIRADPRFQAMLAAAEARLAREASAAGGATA